MPSVTVSLNANGLPTASTHSATRSFVESAHGSGCETLRVHLHDGEIGDVIDADDRGRQLAIVG